MHVVDAEENLDIRRRQLVQMARYGRTGVPGELFGWDQVQLKEFRAIYRALCDVLDEEKPIHGIDD